MVDKDTNQPEETQQKSRRNQKNDMPKMMAEERWNNRRRESSLIKKIVFSIIFIGFLLVLVVGVVGYNYITNALKPFEPENTELVEVEIPMGTSTKGIAEVLESESIIKDATVFNYYLKTQNAPEFQAGFYQFAPSMELDEIIEVLSEGGAPTPISEDFKILVIEGATIDQIAEEFADKTSYSKRDFLDAASNEEYLKELIEEFSFIMTEDILNEEVLHPLEGYLFPATYDYLSHYTPEDVIYIMVQKTDEVLRQYRGLIQNSEYSVHEILTLASLVEKEGVQYEDRQQIAGVFFNRLNDDMPIQSDISVLYALDKHAEYVTIEDTEVESPYNLYQYRGLGPGPFNNPSEDAIRATLSPADTNYYYFLADLSTGEVYFSETFEEHLELQEIYIQAPEE